MPKSVLEQLADQYEAERAKADANPNPWQGNIDRLAMLGSREEHAYYEVESQRDQFDHRGNPAYDAERRRESQPVTGEQMAAQMEREYRDRYGVLPTTDQIQRAAAGIDPEEFFSEHGRELLYARAAKLAGHTAGQGTEHADAFGGRGAGGGRSDPDNGGGDTEQMNDAWTRELQAGRTQAGVR